MFLKLAIDSISPITFEKCYLEICSNTYKRRRWNIHNGIRETSLRHSHRSKAAQNMFLRHNRSVIVKEIWRQLYIINVRSKCFQNIIQPLFSTVTPWFHSPWYFEVIDKKPS